MRRRRWPIGLLTSACLVVLLGVLGTLQYKWLTEVSEADRARRQTVLRQRAVDFVDEFDREIARAYTSFQMDATSLESDSAVLSARYDSWRQNTRTPQLIRSIYVVEGSRPSTIREYQTDSRTLVPAQWPEALQVVRARFEDTEGAPQHLIGWLPGLRESVIPSIPALVVPLTQLQILSAAPASAGTTLEFNLSAKGSVPAPRLRAIVLVIDREYLHSTFLPALADRYFPQTDVDAYRFAIVDALNPSTVVFAKGLPASDALDPSRSDGQFDLFAVRPELSDRFMTAVRTAPAASGRGRLNIYWEQRTSTFTSSRGERRTDQVGANVRVFPSAAWKLVLQHPAGSLQAAVAETRRRNLALSFGILGVLGVSVLMIVMNAQRSQHLAAQQMDFVATVSHELRTPLSVIRSAAQNLSAGVVSDDTQARRYGDLIEAEGQRLSQTVEQVLDFAGLSGNREIRNAAPVDVSAIVRETVASCETLFESQRIQIDVQIENDVPPVLGDAGAIRRALQNLLANALKYASGGRWVGVEVKKAHGKDRDVEISVSDRGPGIDPADLPHIFEAFYRGSHALKEQIHGNGLGLSLVKRIVDAHGGRVTVKSAPGQGTAFAITLRGSS